MSLYHGPSRSYTVLIGGQEVVVDSRLEEELIIHLEQNGFSGLWLKPDIGINVGPHHYTPDLELSVFLDGLTHRALVEVKPAKHYLTADIWRRMKGVASHYNTRLLLLYVADDKSWYRIDGETGTLIPFAHPLPGKIPIVKLYKPLLMPARSIYDHRYKRAVIPVVARVILEGVVTLLSAPFAPPPKPRRSRRW